MSQAQSMLEYLLDLLDVRPSSQSGQDMRRLRPVNVDTFDDELEDRNVQYFVNDVKELTIPTPQAAQGYEFAASRGDREARWLLALASLQNIMTMAKRFKDPRTPLLDLVQEGVLAAYDFTYKWDPVTSRGPFLQSVNLQVFWALHRFRQWTLSSARIATYAAENALKLIRQGSLLRNLQQDQEDVAVYLTDDRVLRGAFPYLASALPPLSLDELSGEYMEPVLEQLWKVIDYYAGKEWTQAPVEYLDLDTEPLSELTDDPIEQVIERVDRELLVKRVKVAVKKLRASEQFIITRYYALSDESQTPLTFQQIADQLGVSRQRVHQLHKRGIERLQRLLTSNRLHIQ